MPSYTLSPKIIFKNTPLIETQTIPVIFNRNRHGDFEIIHTRHR